MARRSGEPGPPSEAGSPRSAEAPAAGEHWIRAIELNDESSVKNSLVSEISDVLQKHKLENYAVFLLFDEVDSISSYHYDRIYSAATATDLAGMDVLLIINSAGGSIEPAYLISKTLKRLCEGKFVVAVPRRAKSAATLISLGADEIHMGLMSQLGPIDPQFGGLPALALGNALDVLADLACRFPGASDLLTNYLNQQTPIRLLGYYQRINESAVQYAERLLTGKKLPDDKTPFDVANHLVNHYKDHRFVIDFDEAHKSPRKFFNQGNYTGVPGSR